MRFICTCKSWSLQSTCDAHLIIPAFQDHSCTLVILGLGPPWTNKNLLPTSSSRTPPPFRGTVVAVSRSLVFFEAMAEDTLLSLQLRRTNTMNFLCDKIIHYLGICHLCFDSEVLNKPVIGLISMWTSLILVFVCLELSLAKKRSHTNKYGQMRLYNYESLKIHFHFTSLQQIMLWYECIYWWKLFICLIKMNLPHTMKPFS